MEGILQTGNERTAGERERPIDVGREGGRGLRGGWAIKSSVEATTLPPESSRNLAYCRRVKAYGISFSFSSV